MEKLLARKGISIVSAEDKDGTKLHFAYTEQTIRKNIFVEIYHVEDIGDMHECEARITVCINESKNSYEFHFLNDSREIIPPLYLYRIIVDLVEIIESSDLSLVEYLKQASIIYIDSEVFDQEMKKNFKERMDEKIKFVLQLIDESRANNN